MLRRSGPYLVAAALLAWCAGGALSGASYVSRFPPPSEIHVPAQGAAGDMFALAFGARRLFADLWFIRLMQYYGTSEFCAKQLTEEDYERCEEGMYFGKGKYLEFFSRARHVMELDPGFASAGLYAATSLAFNMERPEEAEELLRYAIKYSPREWKYLTLLAAIGYSKAQDPAAVASAITPLLGDPDCPVMVKQLAAFLNKKVGNYPAAAAIYADIAATSRDAAYVANARRELKKISKRISHR